MKSFKNFNKNEKTNDEKYLDYLEEHIRNVFKVYHQIRHHYQYLDNIGQLDSNILNHDKSKYSQYEFEQYRQYFYPNGDYKDQEEMDRAWCHHQHVNSHHWQYFVLIEDSGGVKILEMDDFSKIEMLCDWSSFSLKHKNPPSKWYNENKHKMMLHDNTREWIEDNISIFDNGVKELLKGE